jgi:putative ABC transport system permease protein
MMPDNLRFAVLWTGREALAAAFDLEGAFNDVALRLGRGAREAEALAALDRLLARYGGGGAYARKDHQSHAFVSSELDQLALLGRIIPPIFLGIAVFLLNMVVTRVVDTERELIGLFKASGYGNATIAAHYLKFALVIVILGACLGLGGGAYLGQVITELYARAFNFPFLYYRLDSGVVALALLVSLAAGIGGAIESVRRVAALPPAVAMAPPAPVRYRRLLPAGRRRRAGLDQASRMVLRHVVRFPLRALATVFGIALSIGGLVSSLFALDSIDFMIEQDFFRAQRQEITLAFAEPRALSALDAVAQLPGVLAAEPLRIASARLVHGPRARRVAIGATLSGARLTQAIDLERGVVAIPEEGLVLSGALARRLEVRLGETILVEVLEGRRARVPVPVSAIVEESMGLSARMELGALARILGETPTMTGAQVSLDRAREADFHRAVKRLPLIVGVADRDRAVQGFRTTVAENISVSLAIYVGFAGLIAFGVLYNMVRVALSERGRELASLRVIGLTVAEAAYVLVGEIAFLSLAALPLGCLIGYGLAWVIAAGLESDLFRVPLVIDRSTYGFAMLTAIVAATVTSALGAWRVRRLDLIGVLKTRE